MLRLPGFDEAVGACMPQSPRADGFGRHRIVAAAAGVCRSTQTASAAHSRRAPSAQTNSRSLRGCADADRCCAPRFAETSFRADMIRRRVMMTTETTASGAVGLGRGGRMSRQRKRDTVLRMLRGEDLETLSRALGVTAATLTGWRDTFVAAGEASLATRSTNGEALETERLKAKLGEMLLERELLESKVAALEAKRPLARRRSRR